jgi:tRNA-dihydrouridine synthase B
VLFSRFARNAPLTTDLNIGKLLLQGNTLLAPMSGVTDVVMRRIAARLGAAAVVSEMVACDYFVARDAETMLRAEGAGIRPHIVQLAGRDPGWMAEASRLAEACGADVIDINMGCPAKRVTGGYAGSALMRDLDLASRLIDAAVQAVVLPVTVKMRLGWDEDSLNAAALAARAETLGAQLITVHARTRAQFYKGTARWGLVAPVVQATSLPVVVNGDIGSVAEARRALAPLSASGVMIGRAALGRPWLVGAINRALAGEAPANLASDDVAGIAIEHYDGLIAMLGPESGLRHARKHVAAYFEHGARADDAGAATARARALRSEEPGAVRDLLRRVLQDADRQAA